MFAIVTNGEQHNVETRVVRENDGSWASVIVLTQGFPRATVD